MEVLAKLEGGIHRHTIKVGVIGLGYVGLPMALEFAKRGYTTTGIDMDSKRINAVRAGESYIPDVPSADMAEQVAAGRLKATTQSRVLEQIDVVLICVPTPLKKTRDPDMSCVISAADAVAKHVHRGQVIVLESTTYPGTTDELMLPKLEASGLKVGVDFFLGFSPERIDPGNAQFSVTSIPKVVSGVTPACRNIIRLVYEQVMRQVIPVSSTRVAETVKLLENTFRCVNIGLVNEIALLCNRLGIDVWEVIEAAKTKPFGFMAFYPGPGLGGHCIPIDPLYLSWKAKMHGGEARFIDLSSQINSSMPEYVVSRIVQTLNGHGMPLKGSKVLILGVAYKKDVNDLRESPALEVIHKLEEGGAKISYHDPFIESFGTNGSTCRSISLMPANIRAADMVVILTDHKGVDYQSVLKNARLIFDTRDVLRNYKSFSTHEVVRL